MVTKINKFRWELIPVELFPVMTRRMKDFSTINQNFGRISEILEV